MREKCAQGGGLDPLIDGLDHNSSTKMNAKWIKRITECHKEALVIEKKLTVTLSFNKCWRVSKVEQDIIWVYIYGHKCVIIVVHAMYT